MAGLRTLLDEIHRRSLWQVLLVYLGSSWAILEATALFSDRLGWPGWVWTGALGLLLAGLPIILATAYVQHSGRGVAVEDAGGLRGLLTWRNAVAGGVLAFALLGFVTAVRTVIPGLRFDPASVGEFASLAVFPSTVLGDPDLEFLHEGMPVLLSLNLAAMDDVRIVDPGTVIRAAEVSASDAILDVATAEAVAREEGWAYFVLSGVTESAGDLRMQAALYETGSAGTPLVSVEERGDSTDRLDLIDRVSARLLLERFGAASSRVANTAARTSESWPALEAFLTGEQALRAARYDSAVARFQRAVEEDSTFALAHFRMALASGLMETDGNYRFFAGVAPDALAWAVRHADRLVARDARLLTGYAAFRKGEADAAEATFREVLAEYTNDTEARFLLAQVLLRQNPARGRPALEAREHFEQVLEDDPGFICPL